MIYLGTGSQPQASSIACNPFSRRMRVTPSHNIWTSAVQHNQTSQRAAEMRGLERQNRSIEAIHRRGCGGMSSSLCDGGLVCVCYILGDRGWPISMPSLRSSPWIRGAPHSGLARLMSESLAEFRAAPLVCRRNIATSIARTSENRHDATDNRLRLDDQQGIHNARRIHRGRQKRDGRNC